MDAELYKIWKRLQELEENLINKEERISELENRLEAISPTLTPYDKDQVLYAVGFSANMEEFGMVSTPNPDLNNSLLTDIVSRSKDKQAYIIKFEGEETTPIYLWDHDTQQWISLES